MKDWDGNNAEVCFWETCQKDENQHGRSLILQGACHHLKACILTTKFHFAALTKHSALKVVHSCRQSCLTSWPSKLVCCPDPPLQFNSIPLIPSSPYYLFPASIVINIDRSSQELPCRSIDLAYQLK